MTGIFETAEGAVFIRDIHDATPEIHFPLPRPFSARDYEPWRGEAAPRLRTYQLYDRCNRIAFYREKVV